MGIYLNTLKLSKTKNAIFNGEVVRVGVAEFLTREQWGDFEDYHATVQRELIRVESIPEEAQPDYVVFDGFDGVPFHRSNKLGVWSDGSGHWTGLSNEIIGTLFKIGKRYHVVPTGVRLIDYMKENFSDIYNKYLPHTQVYVKINKGYTATVRLIDSLDDFINGFGAEQVDEKYFRRADYGSDVPMWFLYCVDDLIREWYINYRITVLGYSPEKAR
jgi:hypothetical protein